ncbi:App1 family protein [Microbacterium sp. YY-01]|uniref:App1 family protein n=1 Tax=Microbacterium sp. YY-01 TaxID=3421634 RepID=UPI003D18450C
MPAVSSGPGHGRIHWFARLEHRLHAWREGRARRRGHQPTIVPFPGYGGPGWVRVVGRVLILPPRRRPRQGSPARGWRSFAGIPVSSATVTIHIDGVDHDVIADRGGVIDTVIPAELAAGWQTISMSVENRTAAETSVFVVSDDTTFGVVCDVDDTVMVTALPRPLVAAWNSFVVDEHARMPVPGMAVLLDRLMTENPNAPMVYLSTGAWNVAPTLSRFLSRHLFPRGAFLLTDWGPTHDRWFRSGQKHKLDNLRRLAQQFPHVRWLLIGDDGQHDPAIYTTFAREYPEQVAGIAIRRLLPAEAVLAGARGAEDTPAAHTPWVSGHDGARLHERLIEEGIMRASGSS